MRIIEKIQGRTDFNRHLIIENKIGKISKNPHKISRYQSQICENLIEKY